MSKAFQIAILTCALAAGGLAQTDFHCSVEGASPIEHRDGVTEFRADFRDAWGSRPINVSAHAFVPDGDKPVAGIVFSVSAIQKYEKRTDLLPFARALARAGASSIVVERSVKWEPLDEEWNLAPSVMHCAGQWMLLHVKLDRDRLANAGPERWMGDEDCGVSEYQCWNARAVLNFGETGPAESRNTEDMMTREGQLRMANFARQHLSLSEVRAEWLSVETRQAKNEP